MIWRSSTTAKSAVATDPPIRRTMFMIVEALGISAWLSPMYAAAVTGIMESPRPRPAGEQRDGQQGFAGRRRDEGERDRGHRHQQNPEGHHLARPDAVGDPARPAHGERRTDALGGHQQSRHPGLLPAGHLVVDGQEEHGAEQRGADDEDAHVGDGEVPVPEGMEVQQRVRVTRKAWKTKPTVSTMPSAKLTRTEVDCIATGRADLGEP